MALAQDGGGAGNSVLTRLDHIAPVVPVLIFALPVALTMLAVADVRAGLVPRWVIPAAVLVLLAGFVPAAAAGIGQLVLGLAVFGRIAYRILGMSDAEWESGRAADAPSSPEAVTAPTAA